MTTKNIEHDKNLETFAIVWLDDVGKDSEDTSETRQRLRTFINHFKAFANVDQCREYLQSSPEDRFLLIVSGRLGQEIVPHIHHLRQVYSIYIYCLDRERHERWTKRYPKVKGIAVTPDELVAQIRSNQEKRTINEPLSMTFFLPKHGNNEFNDQFIYYQLLVNYLLHVKPIIVPNSKELISLCKDEYKGNTNEWTIIHEFEENYTSDRALWWYTRESGISRLLTKAFRIQDVDMLLICRFFIRDIQRCIEQNRCTSSINVYRSTLLSMDEIQSINNSLGEFVSFDGFFSAYLHRSTTIAHLNNPDIADDLKKVLFEIIADPHVDSSKPFCNVTLLSYFTGNEHVLFALGSIFRLVSIHQQDEGFGRVWIIRMKLSSEKHKTCKHLYEQMIQLYGLQTINHLSFGRVLRKMSKFDEAEQFYRRLLRELPCEQHQTIADCQYGLGVVADEKGDYQSSLEWHESALKIKIQTSKINHPSIGYSYNSMANVYQKIGDHKHALDYYNRTYNLWKKAFGENDPDVAMCLNNMGCIYEKEKKYSEALECHQKALAIKKLHLPADHLNLGATHNNLASVHASTGQIDLALEHFHLSLKIKGKALPVNHPDIALTVKNIGLIYEIKGDFSQAKACYERAANIRRYIFTPTHPDVIRSEQDLRRIALKLN